MKSYHYLLASLLLVTGTRLNAQDIYQSSRAGWLVKAEENKPALVETTRHPVGMVKLVKDATAFQGWKAVVTGPADVLYQQPFDKLNEVILDFGEHLTGYFEFKLDILRRTPDAPLKFKLTFGELPSEIATPFDPYKGDLSRAWLQDETMTVMDVPSVVKVARRMAFRYVKIELLGSSQYYSFRLADVQFKALTSVKQEPIPLMPTASALIQKIDEVGRHTLKECMQTVYEDGPKRDRRLWIGDLYLESLANSYSFKNFDLTKRCLYLLAGLSAPNGFLYGTVFEKPAPHPQDKQFLMDYAFLYNAALKEYLEATHDEVTANELWPVAKRQLDIIRNYVQSDGLMDFEKANKEWWLFFDWKDGLHKAAALQGIAVFTLNETYQLARLLHRDKEVKDLPALMAKMKTAARKRYYNSSSGLIESGEHQQISYASQIWFVLSGILSPTESQKSLAAVQADNKAIYPGGPYLYHFYIQALINAGMPDQANKALTQYWGGMVQKGADTFWEVYDPGNDYLSPYNFFPINSYCHAWSCTPVYFIRKYPQIFQH